MTARGLAATLHDHSRISRFVMQKRHIRSSDLTIRHNAFMPPNGRTEISAFHTDGIVELDVWALGARAVPDRTIRGRGDLQKTAISRVGLSVDYDNVPPRHLNIAGYPTDKDQQVLKAQELARRARLVLP